MHRLRSLPGAEVRRVSIVVVAVDLPGCARPGGVGHPQQPARVAGEQPRVHPFEDRAVRLVVEQLRLVFEVLETGRRAQPVGHCLHEAGNIARFALVPVVIGPGVADRPLIFRRHHRLEGFERREGRRADFGREAAPDAGEIGVGRLVVPRAAVGHVHVAGIGDVGAGAIGFAHQLFQRHIEHRWRHTFIAADPEGYRRVVLEPADRVRRIGEEQRRIARLAIVILGREPEVVEHQHAVFVSQIVEHAFGALAHPVADGIDVGLAVEAEIGFHALARDALHPVVHPPVAATHGDGHAVDADQQIWGEGCVLDRGKRGRASDVASETDCPAALDLTDRLVPDIEQLLARAARRGDRDALQFLGGIDQRKFVADLADAETDCAGVACGAARADGQRQVMEGWRAIAIGPPQLGIADSQFGKLIGGEADHGGGAWGDRSALAQGHIAKAGFDLHRLGRRTVVDHGDGKGQLGERIVGERQDRVHVWIAQPDIAGGFEHYVLPYPGVAIAHGRDPVPTFARGESRAVDGHFSAIEPRPGGQRFLMRQAGMWRRRDTHGHGNALARLDMRWQGKAAACEGTRSGAELLPVEPDLGSVVDAVECQRLARPGAAVGQDELGSQPVILPAETVRDQEIVESVSRVGVDPVGDIGGKDRPRHDRRQPAFGLVAWPCDGGRGCRHLGRGCETPCTHHPPVIACGGKRGTRFGARDCGLHDSGGPADGERCGILRRGQAHCLLDLQGPGRTAAFELDQPLVGLGPDGLRGRAAMPHGKIGKRPGKRWHPGSARSHDESDRRGRWLEPG